MSADMAGTATTSGADRSRRGRRVSEILCAYTLFVAGALNLCAWMLRRSANPPVHPARDILIIGTILLAAVAAVLLLRGAAAARPIAGCAIGLLLSANLDHLLSSFDGSTGRFESLLDNGGWTSIPITGLVSIALVMLVLPIRWR